MAMLGRLDSVTKTHQLKNRTVTALDGVSLELRSGEFLAIRGPSGCGKSTLLMTLGGMQRPDSGTVHWLDDDIYGLSGDQRTKRRAEIVGFVFQQFHLVPYLSIMDNVLSSRLAFGDGDSNEVKTRAIQLIERFGLQDRIAHRPGQLSIGERQRVAMARAMLNSPKILLADEPTGNLDEANANVVLEALKRFAEEGGAVLLVTHDDRAAAVASKNIAMDSGRLSLDPSVSDEPVAAGS